MIYIVKKSNWMQQGSFANLKQANEWLAKTGRDENEFLILRDFNMSYVSRIVYVDGECIYNNRKFWTETVFRNNILQDYENHIVFDFLGERVDKERFEVELNENLTRMQSIDGIAGEIAHNIEIGNELISLLREECIDTDLQTVTPMQIFAKTTNIVLALMTGSFREAQGLVNAIEPDEFFTVERIKKYSDMLAAADVIEYATPGEYIFNA